MDKYFLFWHDYDGANIEEFDKNDVNKLEKRFTELMQMRGNGLRIEGVILGKQIEFEDVEVTTIHRIKR